MFFILTEDADHYHVGYLPPGSLEGITSFDNDHSHVIQVRMQTIEPDDPQVAPSEEVVFDDSGNPVVDILEFDGHTHDLKSRIPREKSKVKDLSEDDAIASVLELYKEAEELEEDFMTSAERLERYIMDDQWEQADEQALDAKKRAHITVNEVQAKMNILSGYQRQNRTDIKFKGREDGDMIASDILNDYVKQILDWTEYSHEETLVFEDQSQLGRGNFHIHVDYSNSLRGDIRIEKFNWSDILYGPHEKLNGEDCEYILKQKWVSFRKAAKMFPDKFDDLDESRKYFKGTLDQDRTLKRTADFPKGTYLNSMKGSLYDCRKDAFRLIELNEVVYTRIPVLFNVDHDFYFNASNISKEVMDKIGTIPGIKRIFRVVKNVRFIQIIGDVFISQGDLLLTSLPVVPAYALRKGNKIIGKLHTAKGMQDEINKRHSQITDIINKCALYGILYEKGAFSNPSNLKQAQSKLSSPGFMIEVENIERIKVMDGINFPSEITNLYQISSQKLNEILGINEALIGQANGQESAIVFRQRKNQALIANEYLFDNLSLSKKRVARLLLELIQKVKSPREIARVVMNSKNPELSKYSFEDILEIMENTDLSKFDVIITEDVHRASNKESNFAIWSELISTTGLPSEVWLPFLLKLSDAPNQDKLMEDYKKWQDAQSQASVQKEDTEVEKSKTPEIKNTEYFMETGINPVQVNAQLEQSASAPQNFGTEAQQTQQAGTSSETGEGE